MFLRVSYKIKILHFFFVNTEERSQIRIRTKMSRIPDTGFNENKTASTKTLSQYTRACSKWYGNDLRLAS